MTERLVFPGKRKWLALVVLVLVAYAIPAFAAYEPTINSGTNVQASTDDNAPVQPLPDEDVSILLDIPAPTGSDEIVDVKYLWTESKTALSEDDLTQNATHLNDARTSWSITRSVQDFVNDDSDTIRYLHVMTFYLAGGTTPSYSSETVIALNIDNVAPTGTVRIVDGEGNDITTTTSSQVDVNLSADSDTVSVYLSEAPVRPGSPDVYTAQPVFPLSGTSGDKTLYAWFEDTAGNISSQPVTDTVTLIDSSQGTINPSTATLDLADVKEQLFVIEGPGETTFNWEISNGTVAKFVGESNGTRNATVQGLVEGSFVVTATPVGGDPLTTGTIDVVQTYQFSLDIDDDGEVLAFKDIIIILRYLFNYPGELLVDGLLNEKSKRGEAEIREYLRKAVEQKKLDIDLDGEILAFKDCILILRYLFNYPGELLTDGLLNDESKRNEAQIREYLNLIK
jgi:hypothetical protein